MLLAKIQDDRTFVSGEEDVLRCLPYMGVVTIWLCDLKHLDKLSFVFSQKDSI